MSERGTISFFFCVVGLILAGAVVGFAQGITDFSVGPATLVQQECYDAWVTPLSPGMSLDIQYTFNGGPLQTLYGWPVMDEAGYARNICTSLETAPGTYFFVSVRNSQSATWTYVGKSLTVLPQPTGFSFDAAFGYAGIDHYVITATGGASMNLRLRYNWNGNENLIGEIPLDASGQFDSGLLDHYLNIGSYLFTGIQNAAAQSNNWVSVNVPYVILPPQPTSFYLDKPVILNEGTNGDQTYHMHAGNGADVLLDIQYTINDGPLQEIDYWPWLYRDSPTSWNGHSDDINATTCTIPGLYRFTAVRNSFNAAWVPVSPPAQLTVIGPGPPQIFSINPPIGSAGNNLTVTISGQRFCGVTLTTNYPGLLVSVSNSFENQVFAAFNIAPTAPTGTAVVTLHALGGSTEFHFSVVGNGSSAPTITGLVPSSAPQGSSVAVTVTGTNLAGLVLSTAWPGLTFSNVTPNAGGTSFTATFAVSASAPVGNPSITVTTPAGAVVTQLFWIGTPVLPSTPALSREYIYLGDRVLVVESP